MLNIQYWFFSFRWNLIIDGYASANHYWFLKSFYFADLTTLPCSLRSIWQYVTFHILLLWKMMSDKDANSFYLTTFITLCWSISDIYIWLFWIMMFDLCWIISFCPLDNFLKFITINVMICDFLDFANFNNDVWSMKPFESLPVVREIGQKICLNFLSYISSWICCHMALWQSILCITPISAIICQWDKWLDKIWHWS